MIFYVFRIVIKILLLCIFLSLVFIDGWLYIVCFSGIMWFLMFFFINFEVFWVFLLIYYCVTYDGRRGVGVLGFVDR